MSNDLPVVNDQIVDATSSVVTLSTGQAPAQAFGMLDAVLLETLGIAMYNAVNRQQGSGMLSAAAVTSACAKMLSVPFPTPPAPTPTPPAPSSVSPLPGPPHESLSPTAIVAAATAEAQVALNAMKQQATDSTKAAAQAQQDMEKLAASITAVANVEASAAGTSTVGTTPAANVSGTGPAAPTSSTPPAAPANPEAPATDSGSSTH
ncbi:RebB family R body protein [Uliginosibacterium gangwonense]|uniref:RebB family R body protein n=1 Tax=Uliginosibacterium gangwonense TaxID=392736 RepID=UPI0003753E38|nr:RebB family R body protein [Uliginosibacterium gangwonense]